ncbi:MAG: AAA family ATPase [Rhizobiales bacterium]|nr:AAA family ATPase [Hyphomicrobiales bacterium]
MRIRALRLRDTGCFAGPVAVEGIADGVNVLAGPNELGKSTILRALKLLLTTPAGSTARQVQRLRRNGAGAPVIEADVEFGTRLLRIAKTYRERGRQAAITDLGDGRMIAEGADVDGVLTGLIEAEIGERGWLDRLWVEQGAALGEFVLGPDERGMLAAVIERGVEAAAGGARTRAIQARVAAWLAQHETTRGPAKHGPWHLAREAEQRARAQLEEVAALARAADGRLARLSELGQRLAALERPEARARRENALDAAQRARETGEAAQRRLAVARALAERDGLALAGAERAFDELARSTRRRDELDLTLRRLLGEEEVLASRHDELARRSEHIRASRDAHREAGERARQDLERFDAESELERARRRLEEAHLLNDEIADLDRRRSSAAIDPRLLTRLEAEVADIAALETTREARTRARAARVTLDLSSAAVAGVTIDGRAVRRDESFAVTSETEITISGIGRILVAPGRGDEDDADLEADLAAHRQVLGALLVEIGVSDAAGARARAIEAHDLAHRIDVLRARLAGLAPDGTGALENEVATLAERLTAVPVQEFASRQRGELQAALEGCREAWQAAERALRLAEDEWRAGGERLAEVRANLASARKESEEVDAVLPPLDQRETELAGLEAAAMAARERARESALDLAALRQDCPDDVAVRALVTRETEAREAFEVAEAEIAAIAGDMRVLDAELERDRQADVMRRLEETEVEHARARDRLAALEAEVAAHRLLRDTLDAVAAASRERFERPLLARVAPYLEHVLPGAGLGLDDRLAPATLARAGVRESVGDLSDGTQEQIAILARLAVARLLADEGHELPLILDDALVYSDDERIARAFAALELAGQHHQVIVLTCRQRAFDDLGGNRLSLVAGEPARGAGA